uniref:DNA-directed RNA polymerase n=1 Tax=Koshicola spirodelophila TaxID=1707787 RepID=A0A160E764_9CHLO|nr:beta subunit of RNA polymerase b [Koshicola spirodelophila]
MQNYQRSNQDTCMVNLPSVQEGDWVQSGDLLADSATSKKGQLSIGKNILIAYMPWEGYNYEDAILISERLVYDDIYTSIHIEKYETKINSSMQHKEKFTNELPNIENYEVEHLDQYGISKEGSWLKEGDILIGKITMIDKKIRHSNYDKLLKDILGSDIQPTKRDTSLRMPKGLTAKIIQVKKKFFLKKTEFKRSRGSDDNLKASKNSESEKNLNIVGPLPHTPERFLPHTPERFLPHTPERCLPHNLLKNNLLKNKELLAISKKKFYGEDKKFNSTLWGKKTKSFTFFNPFTAHKIKTPQWELLKNQFQKSLKKHNKLKDLYDFFPSNRSCRAVNISRTLSSLERRSSLEVSQVRIYLAEKRKIQVGDKMSGRHGNKGIISLILPIQDMPYLPDGSCIDIVLNPLGVPSRMNVGQIYECLLGLAGKYLGEQYEITPFDELFGPEASRSFVFFKLFEASKKTGNSWLFQPKHPGKTRLLDGRTGECFDQAVTVGYAYILKLVHLVDDKIHCLSENHDVLCKKGWVPIKKLSMKDEIATCSVLEVKNFQKLKPQKSRKKKPLLNVGGATAPHNPFEKFHKYFKYEQPKAILHFPGYTGKMYHINNQKLDINVTLNHRMWLCLEESFKNKNCKSVGPYSLITQQPLRGRSKQGGQRLGEMEVWALEAYGAAFTLLELLTIKSDDVTGRLTIWDSILRKKRLYIGTPASFKVLLCELQALCLDIGIYGTDKYGSWKKINLTTLG